MCRLLDILQVAFVFQNVLPVQFLIFHTSITFIKPFKKFLYRIAVNLHRPSWLSIKYHFSFKFFYLFFHAHILQESFLSFSWYIILFLFWVFDCFVYTLFIKTQTNFRYFEKIIPLIFGMDIVYFPFKSYDIGIN